MQGQYCFCFKNARITWNLAEPLLILKHGFHPEDRRQMTLRDLFLGGSQKATKTNKLICVLEQPAYVKFLKESTTLLTIFKGLNWKLRGGIVCTYWWNGPIKTGGHFWQQCSAEGPAPMQQNLEKKPNSWMEVRIAKDTINSQEYVLEK